jgi:hypothetical protein
MSCVSGQSFHIKWRIQPTLFFTNTLFNSSFILFQKCFPSHFIGYEMSHDFISHNTPHSILLLFSHFINLCTATLPRTLYKLIYPIQYMMVHIFLRLKEKRTGVLPKKQVKLCKIMCSDLLNTLVQLKLEKFGKFNFLSWVH